MKPDKGRPFPVRLARAFGYAIRGVTRSSRDRMIRCQFVAGVVAVGLAAWLGLSRIEWAILALTIGLVVAMEVMNTAVEHVVDLASPDFHDLAGRAKDAAAGAVLLVSIAALIVGAILFVPRLIALMH